MVAINRLTVRGIAGLADGNHSDGGNLYLRKKGQRASWVFRYKLKGRVKELGLGSYPSRSLSEARKVAAELRTQLLDGLPVRSLKSQRQDSDVPTLTDSALAYIEAKRLEWTNNKHAQQWTNTLETYVFPKIGDYLPAEVDLSAVEAVLRPIWSQKNRNCNADQAKTRGDLRLDNRPRVSVRRQSCAVEEQFGEGISLSSKNKPCKSLFSCSSLADPGGLPTLASYRRTFFSDLVVSHPYSGEVWRSQRC